MATPDFSKVWASNSPLPEYTFSDADYVTGWDFVGQTPPTKNEFDAWFRLVDTKLKWLYDQMQQTASKLYPVGSVYISFNATDPSTLFGGTWERLKDTFLLANGDAYAPNITGGSATKSIAVSNLPSHTHTISTEGNHTHDRGTMEITGQFRSVDMGDYEPASGAFSSWGSSTAEGAASGNRGYDITVGMTASKTWVGYTSYNGLHTHIIGNTGSSLPLNIMPPYQTVYMWRRTA